MMNWINKKRNKKGFTLVELVVVIAILGILAAVAVPRFTTSRASAAKAAHNANVRTLESAGNLAAADGTADLVWGAVVGTGTVGKDDIGSGTSLQKGWGNYMQSWPAVPAGSGAASADYTVTITGTKVVVSPIAVTP